MTLTLFHRWECPFSRRVREFIEANGLRAHVSYADVDLPNVKDELEELTGRSQVPCLQIDDQALFESADIIEWLRRRLLQAQPENRQPTLPP